MSIASTCNVPPVEVLDTIDSTNLEARRRAETGSRGPIWLRAECQTAAVGRSGRAWHSPPGNLTATLLMPFRGDVSHAALVSFVACLAVADVLDGLVSSDRVSLKWPNDPLLDGKKIAGVLLESGGDAADRWLAVGVGLNLAHKPEDARWPPIALSDVADAPSAEVAMVMLAKAFSARMHQFEARGFGPIRTAWLSRAARLGEPIEARLPKQTLKGVFRGIGEDGALLLDTDAGETRISAADIHFPA